MIASRCGGEVALAPGVSEEPLEDGLRGLDDAGIDFGGGRASPSLDHEAIVARVQLHHDPPGSCDLVALVGVSLACHVRLLSVGMGFPAGGIARRVSIRCRGQAWPWRLPR